MGKQDYLIDLIRSLSKSEKRYFKLFASRYKHDGEKKYMGIFRLFEKQKHFDSEEILDQLKKASDTRNLAADKHYLSEMLLTSLRQFHTGSTVQMRLGNELLSADLLRRRGLFVHALRRLLRIKKELIHYELPELILQAINLECEIRSAGSIEWPEISSALSLETETWLQHMIHLNHLNRLRIDQLRISVENGRPQTEKDREEWKSRLERFNPEISLTGLVTEKALRLRAHSHVYFVLQDIAAADKINLLQYDLFCKHPEQSEKSPVDYLAFLFRYISTSIQVENYRQAGELLNQVRAIRRKYEDAPFSESAVFIDERLLSTELFFFGKSGSFDKMREKADEAEEFIQKTESNQKAVIGFNMSAAFIFSGQYRKVIQWAHRALSYSECKKNYILFLASNLHQLLAHIELNDFDAAMSRVNAARRFVQQRKNQQACVDIELINTLSRYAGTDQPEERQKIALQFQEQFETNAGFMHTDEYVAIRLWLAKQSGRPWPDKK